MIVERIWTGNSLRNFNYLVACPETGEALAIDPLDSEKRQGPGKQLCVAALPEWPMTSHHSPASLATKSMELWWAAPQVVAMRLMAPGDRAEMFRMGAEKAMAFSQAWLAMWSAWWLMPLQFGLNPRRAGSRAAVHLLGESLAPIHRTAVANARRLSRRKR